MTQYKRSVDDRHRSMMLDLIRFYDDAPEADGIIYAAANEVENVRYNARDLLAQFSAITATWGLTDWERVLELPPRPNSSDELRRSRILAKLRGTAPATLANMLAIANAHVPNKDASITELPTPGAFNVEVPLQYGIDFGALYNDLHTYKPAHLMAQVYGLITDTASLIGSDYSFMVPWLICNEFTTDDADGLGVFADIDINVRGYGFDVLFPITNDFTTDIAKGLGVIDAPASVSSSAYNAVNVIMACGEFYAEEAF